MTLLHRSGRFGLFLSHHQRFISVEIDITTLADDTVI